MADLPFRGIGYKYQGRDETKRQKVAEKNRHVAEAARIANIMVADNPREVQVLSFAIIASRLGCDPDIVRHAIGNGGHNGITIRVTTEHRIALERFRSGR